MRRYEDLLIFKDEHEETQKVYVEIIKISDGFITFKTIGDNIITIPTSRMIKIKRKGER